MSLTDAQLTELYDKQALHDNLMLYARGADRHDRELMKSTYWPDSFDDHGSYVGDGQGWADAAMTWHDKIYSCSHHVSNVLSEIDGNRAKRESMFICVVPFKDPEVTMFQAGRYRDLCEKRGECGRSFIARASGTGSTSGRSTQIGTLWASLAFPTGEPGIQRTRSIWTG